MLTEIQFTMARKSTTEWFDNVWHRYLPALIKRRQAQEILVIRRDLQQDILAAYKFRPEVSPEEDGSVTLSLDELDLAVNAPTIEEAADQLTQEIKIYAQDYLDRLQLFINSTNRKAHFPYMLRTWLCNTDEEIKSLLELQV
ncbi:MAG TPA: exoribonuclease R [Spirochaetia bacterium]|nr:exoribonuclease R [Spirochaetia bacterium]